MIVDADFPDHWKTRMFVDLLDGDEAAPVYILRLWAHCQNRKKSEFENFPQAALKAVCRFPGHANKFESSLIASGFVRRENDVLIVCGWMDYNAGLVANWENGKKGGRPKKKPVENPPETHGKPMKNPSETDKSRVDKSRVDKKKERVVSQSLFKNQIESAVMRARALFAMRPSTKLDRSQLLAVKNAEDVLMELSEQDWEALEAYYAAPQSETYSRKTLAAFLNNINGELSKAQSWAQGKRTKTYSDGKL